MKKAILEEYLREIKVLVDLLVDNCTLHSFSFGIGTTTTFNEWWGKLSHSIFKQGVKKGLGCFKLGETAGIIPLVRTPSELY